MADYRRLFLDGYSYFITVVTHQRTPILIEHIELLRESFRECKKHYRFRLEAIVILPDHFHMIITPDDTRQYPEIVKAIKYNLTKRYQGKNGLSQSYSRYKNNMRSVWQKRYYEHTIRDEKDRVEKIEYMRSNPVKHGLVDRWDEWEYSSFVV